MTFLALAHMVDATQVMGWGGMMTFLALAHMVDATQVMGWGGMMTFLAIAHMVDATQVMGWGGHDDVPCTCTHGRCYASHGVGWGGVGLMTFLALATLTWHAWSMLRNRWWGGVGCKSIVDLARMVNATQQMVGWCGV